MSTQLQNLEKFIPQKSIPFKEEWLKLTEELMKAGVHPKIAVDLQTVKNIISSKSKLDGEQLKLFCGTFFYAQREILEKANLEMIFSIDYIPPSSIQFNSPDYLFDEELRDKIFEYLKGSKSASGVSRDGIKITGSGKSSQFLVKVKAKDILMQYSQNPGIEEMELLWNVISVPQLAYTKDGIRERYETFLWYNFEFQKKIEQLYDDLEKKGIPPSQRLYSICNFLMV
jgi:hypothetical protein